MIYRLANIFEGYLVRQPRRPDCRRNDETNFSALGFFVERNRFENSFTGESWRQPCRQFELPQKIDNRVSLIAGETGFLPRHAAGCYHSEADRFAMQKFSIIAGPLDSVPDGVTKIQQRALAGPVELISCNDSGFNFDVPANKRNKLLARPE